MKPWKVPIRRIVVLVTAAHLLVIVVLIGSGFIELSRAAEPQPITVTLMEEPTAAPPEPTPAPIPVAQDPPPQPEPPPPQPEPEPEPAPAPEPEPAPAPEPEPEPAPQPKPQPPPPKPKPKPEPKPKPKPERRYRTPEEIRQSATLRRPSRPRPQPPPTLPSFDADRFAKNLQQGITEITVAAAPSRTSSSNTPPSSASPQRWYDAVGAELYRLWRQPTRAEVGHGNPDVTVSLEVAADGRVINARIVRRSGVAAMDSSVDQLISALTSVAGFKRFGLEGVTRSVTITFRVK